jgi:hypothetical protein
MSADATVTCGRCGGANRPDRARCWVCYTPLDEGTDTRSDASAYAATPVVQPRPKPAKSPWKIALTVVLISVGIMVMIPVLLIITCFGIFAFSSPSSFR